MFLPRLLYRRRLQARQGGVLSHRVIKNKVQAMCVLRGKHPMLTIVGLHLVA